MFIRSRLASRKASVARLWVIPLLALPHVAGAQGRTLGPPTTVEAAAQSATSIRIYWERVPGATKYLVVRDGNALLETTGEPLPAPPFELGISVHNQLSYLDASVQPGAQHRYAVAAIVNGVRSMPSRPYLERSLEEPSSSTECDLLVVGANAGGVSAAVTAARYGLKVVLLEDGKRLGGMCANGLGASDIRRIEHASGFFEEFRRKVVDLYGGTNGLKYEPRISHQAIKELIWDAPGLVVHRQWRAAGVRAVNGKVVEVYAQGVQAGARAVFRPKVVIDATECGDVAAWAGGNYRIGREPRSAREPHAGHIYYSRQQDRILPGSTGKGDRKVQAYSYLMIVKDYGPGTDRSIPMPPGYDPRKYDHAPKFDVSWAKTSGKLPNDKYEINQHPHGSDLQGINWGYAEASPTERKRIERAYREHALGYLYYIQTVEGKRNIGLSEDDYRDNGGWPTLLYIRESRRFDAGIRMDETDIRDARMLARPNAIGIGDYAMDSHAVEPKTNWDQEDMGEGEYYLPQYTPWHQVPFNIMIPKGLTNLFCPTAISATHVAYGTYRMEPVRMLFGASAGIGAYFSLRFGVEPKDIPVRQVQAELTKQRIPTAQSLSRAGVGNPGPLGAPAILYFFPDVSFDHPRYASIMGMGVRGFFPSPEPTQRTPSSGLTAAPFRPDAGLTVKEAVEHLRLLLSRAHGEPNFDQCLAGFREVESEITVLGESAAITRGLAARFLVKVMGWAAGVGPDRYADLEPNSREERAARALDERSIDSRLWETWDRDASGKLNFRPSKPMSRAEWAELLHLASIHVGPLWFDHPLDREVVRIESHVAPQNR